VRKRKREKNMLTWTGLSFSCCSWGSYGEDQDIAKHIAKQMQSQKIADEAMRQSGRRYYGADGKPEPTKPPKVKSMTTEEELCGDLSRPPQSLLEASLRRVYLHKLERVEKEKQAKKNKGKKELLDVEKPKQPEIFLESFLEAVKEGVKTWADEATITNILDKDVVLVTQDKQTFRGKVAVIRRLNTGMAKLLSVMEQYKGQDFPDIQKEGPTPTEQGTWTMTYTLKRGIMKFRLQDEFTIEGDVVTKLVRKKL